MEAAVITERRFVHDASGRVCCTDGSRAYRFWKKYMLVFDRIHVLARLDPRPVGSGHAVEGPGVLVNPLPDFRGLRGGWRHRGEIQNAVQRCVRSAEAIVVRVPGIVGQLACQQLLRRNYPFAVEVVGDPHDVFAPGVFAHPMRALLRRFATRYLRDQCRQAAAAAYVTRHTLQKRYPPGQNTFSTHYSSADLPDAAFRQRPRTFSSVPAVPRVVTVGSLHRRYKGTHVLIAAMEFAQRQGKPFDLAIVGDGQHRASLDAAVRQANLEARVTFMGQLAAGAAVREQLDGSDLFVLPSLTEGLPRSLLEAMARGMPCLATDVGGIGELQQSSELVAPGNSQQLAHAIIRLTSDPQRMSRLSEANLRAARDYAEHALDRRREACYGHLAAVMRDRYQSTTMGTAKS